MAVSFATAAITAPTLMFPAPAAWTKVEMVKKALATVAVSFTTTNSVSEAA